MEKYPTSSKNVNRDFRKIIPRSTGHASAQFYFVSTLHFINFADF